MVFPLLMCLLGLKNDGTHMMTIGIILLPFPCFILFLLAVAVAVGCPSAVQTRSYLRTGAWTKRVAESIVLQFSQGVLALGILVSSGEKTGICDLYEAAIEQGSYPTGMAPEGPQETQAIQSCHEPSHPVAISLRLDHVQGSYGFVPSEACPGEPFRAGLS